MKSVARVLLLLASVGVLTSADAGHELPFYPSYYPQEIRIETVTPASAAKLLQDGSIHAYIGAEPAFGEKIPETIRAVRSLGSYLVLTFNPASPLGNGGETRCVTAATIMRALAGASEVFIPHPYPVTPYHADYLYHVDLAESAKNRYLTDPAGGQRAGRPALRVRAKGALAQHLARLRWQVGEKEWDVTIEEIDAGDLVASHATSLNGWLGPPWVKEGWFHAYLILSDTLDDPAAKRTVDAISRQLQHGDYRGLTEKLNLERTLVTLLTRSCQRVVVGYTVKREYFNAEFSAGIENIAYDSQTGLNSPLFVRTVKLKDFPWNGWLRLGINGKPRAAWNPIGGFTDPAGRLIWSAVGDPALLPAPYHAGWLLNRIGDFRSTFAD